MGELKGGGVATFVWGILQISQATDKQFVPAIGQPMNGVRFTITHRGNQRGKGGTKERGDLHRTDSSQLLVGPVCRLRSSHLALTALARVNWNPRG